MQSCNLQGSTGHLCLCYGKTPHVKGWGVVEDRDGMGLKSGYAIGETLESGNRLAFCRGGQVTDDLHMPHMSKNSMRERLQALLTVL